MGTTKTLWEILVPKCANDGLEFSLTHHREWDTYVRSISGGITILRSAVGHWVSPEGNISVERVIPVRVYATGTQMEEIIAYTLSHYEQEAVLAYELSTNVKLRNRKIDM